MDFAGASACDPPEWRGWGGRAADGACPGGFRQAWRPYAGLTFCGALVLLAYAWWLDPARITQLDWTGVRIKFAGYVVFGIV